MAQIALRDYLQETEDALSSERIDDALANCQHILNYFPESLEAQRLLGEIYLAQGRLDDAQHSFDWVLTNDPENVIAYCNRALVSERLADYDTALDCYQQAYELSRGNSQIRQEFNQLSARAGQQGFMLSRAGLARIYMRGDLLEQAITEWDLVLAATPERLDARTGLLEAYWREGLNDQAAPLARQILRDVPGCEKALLLLAYVSATTNISSAQEFLQQAQKVDPDLLMAQDIFADMLANHPGDPFLALLQKAPAIIDVASPADLAAAAPLAQDAAASLLANWDNSGNWAGGSDTTWIKPRTREQAENDAPPALIDWGASDADQGVSARSVTPPTPLPAVSDVPDIVAQLRHDPLQSATWDNSLLQTQATQQESGQPEPWQLLQEALQDIDPSVVQHQVHANPSSWDNLVASQANKPQEDVSAAAGPVVDESMAESEPMTSWSVSSSRDDKVQAPPAWMNMLSQAERRQLDEAAQPNPVVAPVAPTSSFVAEPAPTSSFVAEPAPPSQPEPAASQEVPVAVNPVSDTPSPSEPAFPWSQEGNMADDDSESFFGPEWLKALGATSLEGENESSANLPPVLAEAEPVTVPVASNVSQEVEHVVVPEPASPVFEAPTSFTDQPAESSSWMNQFSESTSPAPSWMEQLSQPSAPSWMEQLSTEPSAPSWPQQSQPAMAAFDSWSLQGQDAEVGGPTSEVEPPAEQNLVTTLEELEKNLRSKGFISLEPNSLAAIAQSQQNSDDGSVEQQLHAAQSEPSVAPSQLQQREDASLSSALAELGGFSQSSSPAVPANPFVAPAPQPVAESKPAASAEPSWVTALRAVSNTQAPVPVSPMSFSDAGSPGDVHNEPAPFVPPVQREIPRTPEVAQQPAALVSQKQPQTTRVDIVSAANTRSGADSGSGKTAFPLDPFGGELETTMKRPAVRLQPMQQRVQAPASPPPASPQNRGRAAERVSGYAANGSSSHQERLLKGYQSQLIGDYDDAMQEYRVIIRNAPELLAEVVSNVRALLKLAPTYATGYRVLGDAYMRQGEYLQAMEAYNKALTMTKKAKA